MSEARGRPLPRPLESAVGVFMPLKSGHHPRIVRAAVSVTEHGRHVDVVVEQHRLVQRHVVRHADLDQRIAAADEIGAVRQRDNVEVGLFSSGLA